MGKRIHVELLLGRKVRDVDGQSAGRIEEIRAEKRGGECVIKEYLLGRGALLQRLSISGVSSVFITLLGGRNNAATHRVPWDKLDLSDEHRPRLKCRRDELEDL